MHAALRAHLDLLGRARVVARAHHEPVAARRRTVERGISGAVGRPRPAVGRDCADEEDACVCDGCPRRVVDDGHEKRRRRLAARGRDGGDHANRREHEARHRTHDARDHFSGVVPEVGFERHGLDVVAPRRLGRGGGHEVRLDDEYAVIDDAVDQLDVPVPVAPAFLALDAIRPLAVDRDEQVLRIFDVVADRAVPGTDQLEAQAAFRAVDCSDAHRRRPCGTVHPDAVGRLPGLSDRERIGRHAVQNGVEEIARRRRPVVSGAIMQVKRLAVEAQLVGDRRDAVAAKGSRTRPRCRGTRR
ncbi:MAG: hypothetical protein QOJ39_3861 [Candidatus Eremiobacteraeota bacterium]|nr:hypothetical protein [Candidatus Eremiobacteraeota bacterium]